MWPWGHLAVGYLCYSAGVRLTDERTSTLGVVALAVGTQFPDLVDKPLAWTVAVLPNGRSLAHSLLTFALLSVLLVGLARWFDADSHPGAVDADGGRRSHPPRSGGTRLVAAFLVGYASHLLGDAFHALVSGDVSSLAFLGWPVLPPVQYDGPKSFVGHLAGIEPTPFLLLEFGLGAAALLAWYADGLPGVATLRRLLGA